MSRTALITGAAKGIGAAAAYRLAEDGFNVVINYHSEKRTEQAEELAEKCRMLGVDAKIYLADVSEPEQCDKLTAFTKEHFGSLDVLVNNAGVLRLSPMWTMKDETFDEIMKNNAYSVFYMMRSAANIMKKQHRGRIINVSSVGGLYGSPWSIGYAASKGAVISMTKTAAKELAMFKILVNTVAPGGCDTGMAQYSEQQLKEQLKIVTLKRLSKPSEIASAISFLASEDSSYITGEVLEVSGGVMM